MHACMQAALVLQLPFACDCARAHAGVGWCVCVRVCMRVRVRACVREGDSRCLEIAQSMPESARAGTSLWPCATEGRIRQRIPC